MAYRSGTYVAFDGNGTTNPTKGDMKYYGLLQKWNKSKKFDLNFSDSHKKTSQVKDTSLEKTLKAKLLKRMKNSKNMLLIISKDTSWDRGMLNYEIEKAVDLYDIPIIVAYTGYKSILRPSAQETKWPEALNKRIKNKSAKCIHIPFKEKAISAAISSFTTSNKKNALTKPLHTYSKSVYKKWGYIE